jgi:hypothetical protein
MLNKYGPIETFPPEALGAERDHALLFKMLATLRTDAPVFVDVDEMKWSGPKAGFADWATRIDDKRLLARADGALKKREGGSGKGEEGRPDSFASVTTDK